MKLLLPFITLLLFLTPPLRANDAQSQKDNLIVQALLRLEKYNLHAKEKAHVKAAVLRYLKANPATDEFFTLIEKFKITEANLQLIGIALDNPRKTEGVRAAKILLASKNTTHINNILAGKKAPPAISLLTALGNTADPAVVPIALPIVTSKRSLPTRTAAVNALGKSAKGQRALLKLTTTKKLPTDLKFTTANILLASRDKKIATEAAKHLKLPATAGSKPLPPIATLAKLTGNPAKGKAVYTRACAICHLPSVLKIDFGPNLIEIGDKLPKSALYTAILDPNAGINFGFEGFILKTKSGAELAGYIQSKTDTTITLKIAGGIAQKFKRADIAKITPMKQSLMPENLQASMNKQELVDLVQYLTTLKKKK